jgi:hypothetical protein
MDLAAGHEDEHRQLESEWVQPDTIRKFDKRSSGLLQNRQIEQYMLLCGNLTGADRLKKLNSQTEKAELRSREREMAESFDVAKGNLMRKQAHEIERLRMDQGGEMEYLGEIERKDMTAKTRRVEATQRVLAEEKDYSKFITKKFHKSANIIVPVTVARSRDASSDLPALARGKVIPPGIASMMVIRKRIPVSRLPLALKHYQPPPLVKPVKRRSV